MAREIANIRLSMWADRDWQALSRGAQHLYMYLLSSPSLSYAGVCDWRPNRIVVRSADWSIEELEADRAELERGHFIYVDDLTEEAFIRSFVKYDGLLKHPKLPRSMAKDFAGIYSHDIQDFFVFELRKVRDANPELKCWEVPQIVEILNLEAADMKELSHDSSHRPRHGSSHGLRHSEPIADQWVKPCESPTPSHALPMNTATATATATPNKLGESRSGRKRPNLPLPDDWTPTDAHRQKADELGLQIDIEAEKFRNHALGKDRRQANWNMAFSNWLIQASEYKTNNMKGGDDLWSRTGGF